MCDDEKTPVVDAGEPAGNGDDELTEEEVVEQLEEAGPDGSDQLPGWLERVLESARAIPGGSRRVAVWLPTLAAGWRAAERGMAVASELRERLDGEEPLEWPDELAEEFSETLHAFAETFPELDEAVPMAADIAEFGEDIVQTDEASGAVLEVTRRLEKLAEKALQRLLEIAFFAPEPEDAASRNRRLRNLFTRLEDLFDRLLYLWLFGSREDQDDS